jgi:hypothetical protein
MSAEEILAELVEMAAHERVSDLQIQSSRVIYANKAGSTAPILRWGILEEKTVLRIAEILYAARRLALGAVQEGNENPNALRDAIGTGRKLDFASEGDGSGALRVRPIRVQACGVSAGRFGDPETPPALLIPTTSVRFSFLLRAQRSFHPVEPRHKMIHRSQPS